VRGAVLFVPRGISLTTIDGEPFESIHELTHQNSAGAEIDENYQQNDAKILRRAERGIQLNKRL
jgi:hypothetical protein